MLRYLTAGESHGPALVVVVEGMPAGLTVTLDAIGDELARRRLGFGRGPRMRFERDPQHRVAQMAVGDVARAGRDREAAHPAAAGPRRSRRHAEVRLRRRAQ